MPSATFDNPTDAQPSYPMPLNCYSTGSSTATIPHASSSYHLLATDPTPRTLCTTNSASSLEQELHYSRQLAHHHHHHHYKAFERKISKQSYSRKISQMGQVDNYGNLLCISANKVEIRIFSDANNIPLHHSYFCYYAYILYSLNVSTLQDGVRAFPVNCK